MVEELINQLRKEGEINTKLGPEILENSEEHENYHKPQKVCNPCKINLYPFNTNENIFYETDDFYIVETYLKKGHEIRNMAVLKQHGEIPEKSKREEIKDKLKHITASQIKEGHMTIYGSMNTFPAHYHIVASDLDGEDLEEIHSYELYAITNQQSELIERNYRSVKEQKLL